MQLPQLVAISSSFAPLGEDVILMIGPQRVIFRAFPDCNTTEDFWIPPNLRLEKKVGSTELEVCLTDDLIQVVTVRWSSGRFLPTATQSSSSRTAA